VQEFCDASSTTAAELASIRTAGKHSERDY
jgi:hypothetical protein